MQIINNLKTLTEWVGREVACSDWLLVDQERIQRFADVTGDQQWIHTDVIRAKNKSTFKSTIGHGYLTLSLLPALMQSCLHIDGIGMSINYGLDRVRFPAPVLSGQRVRARLTLDKIDAVAGGVQVHWAATIDIEHGEKPACVAHMLARYYPESPST
jgi:acyl dehydratase